MSTTPTDLYLAGFRARCRVRAAQGNGQLVDAPGVVGLLPGEENSQLRLVIVDDRAYDRVAAALPSAREGAVTVFTSAPACADLLATTPGWTASPATAMAHPDLQAVPDVPLSPGLLLRPVRRVEADDPAGIPLAAAVALVHPDSAGLADHLRSWPSPTRLFAALDADGIVRATSGCGVFDGFAHVVFVNTDAGWQGRGIGTAMTAAAIAAARDHGARRGYLDASAAGKGPYTCLGFEPADDSTRYSRSG